MKILNFLLLFILLLSIEFSYAQFAPQNFNLEKTVLSKINDENPTSNSINDIVAAGDTVWIATSRGVSKSTDRGASWINYFGSQAFGSESSSGIAFKNGILAASTAHSIEKDNTSYPEGSGIRLTTNGGQTWITAPQSVDNPGDSVIVYGINKIRALPVTVAVNNISYDVALTSKYLWTANFAGGLRRVLIDSIIANKNTIWERVILPSDTLNSIKPSDTLKFSLQPVAGKFGPEGWLNHRVFSVIAVDDNNIIVGTAGGINISTDGGSSWEKVNHQNQSQPISGNFVVALGYNRDSKTIWGATWMAELPGEFNAVSYSTDFGESWNTTLENEKCHGFGFKSMDVMAATDNGMYRSENNGTSWILPTAIIDSKTQVPLNTNVFYSAASEGNDVWLGSDAGLAKLTEAGNIWVGEWKVYLASKVLSSQTETYAYPNPFSPDAETVKIKYSTGGARKRVTIRILDFGMNLVKTVIQNAERGDEIHTVDGFNGASNSGVIDYWDGKDEFGRIVPNGVYFYRIDFDSGDSLFGKIMVLM
jgi:ligand-binding sensor domain-containing protein